ncbi:hypothetical protein P389DRAFT_173315 [Cystobasidium minutum MCA 4210]|uniref:uncharacterized protein n=1 Tax=Cystobasidium minutum MCA 4210 TaxID=1397322 RepID=UPI0034CD672A|eukprot:jgi/Rhomi1/173315/fgenesh1_kg.6_\
MEDVNVLSSKRQQENDALSLPSLGEFRTTLEALLQSPFPPRSLFIQASSNVHLLEELIVASLPAPHAIKTSLPNPSVQDLLPQAVIVDCAQIASTKALYGRILNGLSGWSEGQWDDALGGVLNWDGRQEGYSIHQNPHTNSWKLDWDYKNALDIAPSTSSMKGGIIDRKDESFSAFLEGLKMIYTLGSGGEEQDNTDASTRKRRTKPRFVVLLNAERIPALESLPVGQNEGTLLASFMRLGELTGKPIVPVLTSQSEWLLLRPARGATEPAATLHLPSLKRQDVVHYLKTICSRELQASSNLTAEQQISLLTSLADVIHQTFEPYIGDELADYLWLMEKLWPDWRRPVEIGAVEAGDVNRLVAMSKAVLSKEIEGLGELRPLVEDETLDLTSQGAVNGTSTEEQPNNSAPQFDGSQQNGTPRKHSSVAAFYADAPSNASPLAGFSPHAVTPAKRSRNDSNNPTLHPSSISSSNLSNSLSILSRYILIAAFLASSNPSKKDMLMLATAEDELALSKRRKKGGALRKTPNRKSGNANGEDDSMPGGPIRKKDTLVPQRMLGPKPFPIERLIAITETILPVDMRNLAKGPDILQEIANLTSLRLLLKTSATASLSTYPTFTSANAATASISPFDRLDGIKLKCSTGLELDYIEMLGKSVGFKVGERLWELFG